MTIDSSRFHFDLSANFSRAVSRETTTNIQSDNANNAPKVASNNNNFYSRSSSVDLLERALSDGLGKNVDLQANNNGQSPVKTIAKNVLSFVRQELRDARNSGANEQELQGLLNQAREGIEQGFASAREALQGRLETEPRLERQLDRALSKIQRGLERIDNRFAPNVDNVVEQSPGSLVSQTDQGGNEGNAVGSPQANPAQVSQLQTTQIEFSKTRDVQASKSFNLSIETQEGDTVNFNIEKFYSKQVSKQATFNEDGFSVNIDRQIQKGQEISYQVSGDINEQEQAAIDKLIKNIDRLSDKFYSGNFAGAFQKATRIGIDADQLANFSLNLQSSKAVEVTKTYREVQGVPAAQQLPSPVESVGEFIGGVAQAVNDDVVSDVISDPVPVATELFKQIAVRDERFAQLVFEQSVEVIDDIAGLAEQQLANAA
ncbi:MAG: DUF5610 domain-containing protein [Gammaproteobacteria bacterium]